ncbi:hypothetical protein INR49_027101 [Caranx melampygus]|nr:hypothetical protein INR49_027101 [Caranx melampygus]
MALQHLKSTPCTSTPTPEDGGLGCSPVLVSLMLDTRLQSLTHQSQDLGSDPAAARHPAFHIQERETEERPHFRFIYFNKSNFLTRDATR